MIKKKKILYLSDSASALTGFGQVSLRLLKSWYLSGKYEILHLCQGVQDGSPELTRFPWNCRGVIPNNPHVIQRMNQDPNYARFVSYGGEMLEPLVLDFKPDVVFVVNDEWGSVEIGAIKDFWNLTHSIGWVTFDSTPLRKFSLENKDKLKNLYGWSSFAEREFHRLGCNQVKTQFPPVDTNNFKPLSNKTKLKEKYGVSDKKFILNYTFRSQLRKQSWTIIEGYSLLQKEHPEIAKDVYLHFHTSVDEGWNHKEFCQQYNVDYNRLLFTWVCKNCKNLEVKSDNGNKNCPHCKSENSQMTCNVGFGATPEQMNELYNLADCEAVVANSGATEIPAIEALASGLPLATVNYSYGLDFSEQSFVHTIESTKSVEFGTQFIKVMPLASSIKDFILKIYNSPKDKLESISQQGRKWVIDNFSTEVVSKKWQDVIDNLPEVTWDFKYKVEIKDINAQVQDHADDVTFVKNAYKSILNMDVKDDDSGLIHWLNFLKQPQDKNKLKNELVMAMRNAGVEHNKKVQAPISFESLLDPTDKSRVLIYLPQSLGDLYILTSLLPEIQNKYLDSSIYIGCDPKYHEIFENNQYVKKCLPVLPEMQNEMIMVGFAGNKGLFNFYINVGLSTQSILNYLSNKY